MNRVILVGDVDLRYTQSEVAVANFTVAVSRRERHLLGEAPLCLAAAVAPVGPLLHDPWPQDPQVSRSGRRQSSAAGCAERGCMHPRFRILSAAPRAA
jgi:hypothetical protein